MTDIGGETALETDPDPAIKGSRGPSRGLLNDHQSLQERTYLALRNSLLNNEFESGQRIYEVELARELGVSRNPVREAIRRLQQDGLVEVRPRFGIYVATLGLKEIDDLYRIRGALEGVAARLAAERMTDAHRESFETMMRSAKAETHPPGTEEHARAAVELADKFHRAIHQYAQSDRLLDMLELLYTQIQSYRNVTLRVSGREDIAVREHELICRTIVSREGAGSEALMRDHVEGARIALLSATSEARANDPAGPG